VNFPWIPAQSTTSNGLSYNFQLTGDWLVTAAYLGNKATIADFRRTKPAVSFRSYDVAKRNSGRKLKTNLDTNSAQGAIMRTSRRSGPMAQHQLQALRLSAQHRFSHNFTVLSVYTWSHCLQTRRPSGTQQPGRQSIPEPYNRNATTDVRFRFAPELLHVFRLRMPKFANRAVNQLAGNWQLAALFSARTGFPFTHSRSGQFPTGVRQDRPMLWGILYVKNTSTLVG